MGSHLSQQARIVAANPWAAARRAAGSEVLATLLPLTVALDTREPDTKALGSLTRPQASLERCQNSMP